MPHVRQSIRDNLITTLTGLTTTAAKVYPSRVYPVSATSLPGLAIYTAAESVEYLTITAPRTMERTLSVRVEIYAKGVDGYDDSIDLIASEIEAAIYTDTTRGGLAKDTQVDSLDVEFSGEGDQPLARATLNVTVIYCTKEGAPNAAV